MAGSSEIKMLVLPDDHRRRTWRFHEFNRRGGRFLSPLFLVADAYANLFAFAPDDAAEFCWLISGMMTLAYDAAEPRWVNSELLRRPARVQLWRDAAGG